GKVRAVDLGAPPGARGATPNRSLGEAVEAFTTLQSVIAAGDKYEAYSAAVLDAKSKVDRFVQSEPADSPARGAVTRAMQFYTLASTAWNGRLTNGTAQLPAVGRDPVL